MFVKLVFCEDMKKKTCKVRGNLGFLMKLPQAAGLSTSESQKCCMEIT